MPQAGQVGALMSVNDLSFPPAGEPGMGRPRWNVWIYRHKITKFRPYQMALALIPRVRTGSERPKWQEGADDA